MSRAARREALALAAEAERRVASALTEQGYQVLAMNWRTKSGELDVIAVRAGALRFVEVKARRHGDPSGLEAITPAKRSRLIRAARQYLEVERPEYDEVAFMVVLVDLDTWQLEFWDNAFDGG